MKNTLFIFITCLCTVFSLKSQDSLKKLKLGADFSIGNNALGRRNILPNITLSKGRHSIFLGPAFIFGMEYNPFPPQYGVQAGYQFYPNGTKHRFNLFFEYDFNCVNANFKFYYDAPALHELTTRSINVSSVDNYMGFGFRLNIFKWLYLKTMVGVGIIYYMQSFKDTYNDGTVENYSTGSPHVGNFYPFNGQLAGYYYNYYYTQGDKHFVGIIKAGLGCNIYAFKKKNKQPQLSK